MDEMHPFAAPGTGVSDLLEAHPAKLRIVVIRRDLTGPEETFIGPFRAAVQLLHSCHSCIVQYYR